MSNVGVVSLVMLSVALMPVSLPDCRSGAEAGAGAGATVSIVKLRTTSAPIALPAWSVTVVPFKVTV